MSEKNGDNAGPPYAFISQGFAILSQGQVAETLEKNALIRGKDDISLGILFKKIADDFRAWSKQVEPGGLFNAPEANLRIIRLSMFAPVATSLSDAARKQAEAAKEPIPNDRLKIALE
jgi:hypothetical protein